MVVPLRVLARSVSNGDNVILGRWFSSQETFTGIGNINTTRIYALPLEHTIRLDVTSGVLGPFVLFIKLLKSSGLARKAEGYIAIC